jgi:hypothetical protein
VRGKPIQPITIPIIISEERISLKILADRPRNENDAPKVVSFQ